MLKNKVRKEKMFEDYNRSYSLSSLSGTQEDQISHSQLYGRKWIPKNWRPVVYWNFNIAFPETIVGLQFGENYVGLDKESQ